MILSTLRDFVLTGGTFDLIGRHCDGQNGQHVLLFNTKTVTVIWCEMTLTQHMPLWFTV